MSRFSIWGAIGTGSALLFADKRAFFGYLGLALLIPFLLFSIHAQSNFRTLYALAVSDAVTMRTAETPWTILSLFLLSAIGMGCIVFAAWNAMLAESRDGPIGEVMYGLVAGIISSFVSIGIYMAISIPFGIVQVGAMMAIGTITPTTATSAAGPGLAVIPIQFAMLLILSWLSARLCLSGPAMAAAGSLNPFTGLATSWRLTARASWRVFFLMLGLQIATFILVATVVIVAVLMVQDTYAFGWQDSVISLLLVIVEAICVILLILVPMGLYAQLNGSIDSSVFE
jgi:hypothetical protein